MLPLPRHSKARQRGKQEQVRDTGYSEQWLADRLARQSVAVSKARASQDAATVKVAPLPPMGTFTVLGVPIAKPRQTRSDKWKERPCVLRYRGWADRAREAMFRAMGTVSTTAGRLDVVAYFPIPKRLGTKDRHVIQGCVHMSKPDADNVLKACADALCRNDQMIHDMSIKKRWDDGNGPRVEITIY